MGPSLLPVFFLVNSGMNLSLSCSMIADPATPILSAVDTRKREVFFFLTQVSLSSTRCFFYPLFVLDR